MLAEEKVGVGFGKKSGLVEPNLKGSATPLWAGLVEPNLNREHNIYKNKIKHGHGSLKP